MAAHGLTLQPSMSSQHSASVQVVLAQSVLGSGALGEYPVVQEASGKAALFPSWLATHVTVSSVHVSDVLVAELSVREYPAAHATTLLTPGISHVTDTALATKVHA